MKRVRFVLVGLGNLGRRFCQILIQKNAHLRDCYGLDLRLVGAADSQGAAYSPEGLELDRVVALKQSGDTIGHYSRNGRVAWSAADLVASAEAELLLEASPVNLDQGAEPGLTCIRTALHRRMHVVTPNKGPIVLAHRELVDLARLQGVRLRYDGTVAGGLPAVNLIQRDLRGGVVHRIEAVPNLVTGYVIDMLADGIKWDEALARARQAGTLEADASWDLDGWDASAKLLILVNSLSDVGEPVTLSDVKRSGISLIDPAELRKARDCGERYRLLAIAERCPDGAYMLSVTPSRIEADHPLGNLGSKQMGVLFYTDIYGTITAIIDEPDPVPSAATMLRDLLDIYS
jgi:homoserine dehydrogenase